jgi:hypothetical protein
MYRSTTHFGFKTLAYHPESLLPLGFHESRLDRTWTNQEKARKIRGTQLVQQKFKILLKSLTSFRTCLVVSCRAAEELTQSAKNPGPGCVDRPPVGLNFLDNEK